jgi:MazG family protein
MPDETARNESARNKCKDLLELARRLRAPDGCPWDREQTFRTLSPYLLEETHEVLEAIEEGAPHRLKEEMGDLFFLLLFMVALAEEERLFSLSDVIGAASEKIILRHPHVFREQAEMSSKDVRTQWEQIKRRDSDKHEIALKAGADGLPALVYALRIQQKAASFGFDWDRAESVLSKIDEELEELRRALAEDPGGRRTGEELGDLLFSVVNLARHANQDPERVLRATVQRFCRRFDRMAALMRAEGIPVEEADLETMDAFWERTKSQETSHSDP